MKIDPAGGSDSVNDTRSLSEGAAASGKEVSPDTIELTDSKRLHSMLDGISAVRVDKIEKAFDLIDKPEWPSPEIIHWISNLIASKMSYRQMLI